MKIDLGRNSIWMALLLLTMSSTAISQESMELPSYKVIFKHTAHGDWQRHSGDDSAAMAVREDTVGTAFLRWSGSKNAFVGGGWLDVGAVGQLQAYEKGQKVADVRRGLSPRVQFFVKAEGLGIARQAGYAKGKEAFERVTVYSQDPGQTVSGYTPTGPVHQTGKAEAFINVIFSNVPTDGTWYEAPQVNAGEYQEMDGISVSTVDTSDPDLGEEVTVDPESVPDPVSPQEVQSQLRGMVHDARSELQQARSEMGAEGPPQDDEEAQQRAMLDDLMGKIEAANEQLGS